ncbi:MAG: ABC transporter ATP-binding protein [Chloroflexi bacterium]|nr:ABC transporter ATP-binding protein [Chloroflexota bacterium]
MGRAIEVQGLGKRFGSFDAVRDLSFAVETGEIFGFLGPNGAGKTTTMRMLTCLLRPTSGGARVAGHDIVRGPLEVKRRIGYVADGPYLYPKLTGREFLEFIADLYRLDRRAAAHRGEELFSLFDLVDKAGDLVEGYSHGMRQKLALAAALLHDPEVLFLDEPTSGLDPRTARTVKDLLLGLSAKGCTVLFSTHVLEIAEQMCHRVGIIDHGSMIAIGTLDELRAQSQSGRASLEDIFLQLTGGPEAREIAAFLRERGDEG